MNNSITQHSIWLKLLSVYLAMLIILCGTTSCVSNQANISNVLDKEEWQDNVCQFLNLSYVEDIHYAGFGMATKEILLTPDLYTTYAAIGILSNTNQEIEGKNSIIDWINSLQDESGGYHDPHCTAPDIFQTYWALVSLKTLGSSTSDPEAIIKFIIDHQQPNGLFYSPDLTQDDSIEAHLTPTYLSIEILRAADLWSDQVISTLNIKNAMPSIHSYVIDQLEQNNPNLGNGEDGLLTLALTILMRVDPNLVPTQAQEWVATHIEDIESLPDNIIMIPAINRFLDLAEIFELQAAKQPTAAREYLESNMFPLITPGGGISHMPGFHIDPMMTYELVYLTIRSGSSYPYFEELLNSLQQHHTSEGWAGFTILEPSSQSTFYALALANQIEKNADFNSKNIEAYLDSFVMQEDNWNNIREVYYAILAKQELYTDFSKIIEDTATSYVLQTFDTIKSSDNTDPLQIADTAVYCILLADELNIELNTENIQQLYLIEEDLVKEIDSLNMKGLYQLNILQDFLYRNGDINDYQNILSQSIISLSDGNGVFKMIQQSPIPDLDSTFLAVRILDQLGLNDHIDITAIANFTEACREDYGFTIAPSDLLKEANIDIEADLKLTYEALWLLDYCDSN